MADLHIFPRCHSSPLPLEMQLELIMIALVDKYGSQIAADILEVHKRMWIDGQLPEAEPPQPGSKEAKA